jgi:hypothetical protein
MAACGRRGVASAHAARSTVQGPPTSRTGARAQLTDRRSPTYLCMRVRRADVAFQAMSSARARADSVVI